MLKWHEMQVKTTGKQQDLQKMKAGQKIGKYFGANPNTILQRRT